MIMWILAVWGIPLRAMFYYFAAKLYQVTSMLYALAVRLLCNTFNLNGDWSTLWHWLPCSYSRYGTGDSCMQAGSIVCAPGSAALCLCHVPLNAYACLPCAGHVPITCLPCIFHDVPTFDA